MDFKDYWTALDPKAKASLASRANTSVAYLSQVAHGHRKAGANLISRLMAIDCAITFSMMRPTVQGAA